MKKMKLIMITRYYGTFKIRYTLIAVGTKLFLHVVWNIVSNIQILLITRSSDRPSKIVGTNIDFTFFTFISSGCGARRFV